MIVVVIILTYLVCFSATCAPTVKNTKINVGRRREIPNTGTDSSGAKDDKLPGNGDTSPRTTKTTEASPMRRCRGVRAGSAVGTPGPNVSWETAHHNRGRQKVTKYCGRRWAERDAVRYIEIPRFILPVLSLPKTRQRNAHIRRPHNLPEATCTKFRTIR